MFTIEELRHTRFAQEMFEEGYKQGYKQGEIQAKQFFKQKVAPRLLEIGLSIEEVAEILDLEIEEVRQARQDY